MFKCYKLIAICERWKVKTQPLYDFFDITNSLLSSCCIYVPNSSWFGESYRLSHVFEKWNWKIFHFVVLDLDVIVMLIYFPSLNSLIWQDKKGNDLTPPLCVSSKHCILSNITGLTEKNQHKGRKLSNTHLVSLLNKQKIKQNNCFILKTCLNHLFQLKEFLIL